jgi:CheY-like chemotaxis protein
MNPILTTPETSPLRCVVADDMRASRLLLQTWIEACGYICEASANGEEAWQAIINLRPNLVVTDIEMPGASGLDLLCSMRRHASNEIRAIPVIVVSSLVDGDIRQFVHDAGGTYFLPKPLEKEVTQRVVKQLNELASGASEIESLESKQKEDQATRISPTLRRLYREVQMYGPKFR